MWTGSPVLLFESWFSLGGVVGCVPWSSVGEGDIYSTTFHLEKLSLNDMNSRKKYIYTRPGDDKKGYWSSEMPRLFNGCFIQEIWVQSKLEPEVIVVPCTSTRRGCCFTSSIVQGKESIVTHAHTKLLFPRLDTSSQCRVTAPTLTRLHPLVVALFGGVPHYRGAPRGGDSRRIPLFVSKMFNFFIFFYRDC